MTVVTDSFVVCSVKLCKKKKKNGVKNIQGFHFCSMFTIDVRNPSGQLAVKFFLFFFCGKNYLHAKKCILYITTLYIHNSQHGTC